MKLVKQITASVLAAVTLCGLWSCNEDEDQLSKAVLASATTLSFEAQNASEKLITVYSDANWISEVPEWVTISPAQGGAGTTEVTVSVTDNMRDGAEDNPRKATLVFKGSTLASRAEVIISQSGDKYRDVKDYKPSEIAALADESVVSIPDVIVVAVTTDGFIVSDAENSGNAYIINSTPVSVGDRLSLRGTKGTDTQSLAIVECDELEILSTGGTVTYPTAEDITSKVDSYNPKDRTYISVDGVLSGSNIIVEGAQYSVAVTNAPESMGIAALNGHKVTAKGYFAGVAAPVIRITLTSLEDKGLYKEIYFSEDFEWLLPWAENSGAGQTVENDGTGSAPQIYSAKNVDGQLASDALLERGYGLEETPGHAIYLQKCYLKFGKTDYQAGLTLPPIDGIPEGTTLKLSFDWAPMVGGTRKFDPVEVIVSITNGDQVVEMDPIGHSFVNSVDKLEWLHAEVIIEGINITKDTRITIRSNDWGATAATTGSSVYRRWFLDNIELAKSL